jgi:ribosome-associated translation inhibitor RaiA
MAQFDQNLMYEFYAGGLENTDAIRIYANHAVREIKATIGSDADIQVHIEPEAKDKHLFSVSMSIFGLGDSIVVRKQGKHVLAVLRKVRKAVLRQIHKLNEKRVDAKRKTVFREQFAL